jgi:RHS repeat-associated protein
MRVHFHDFSDGGHFFSNLLDGNGKLTKRYVLLPSGQLLAHIDSSASKPAFYHFDALGSTVVMSDSSKRIATRFVYEPYGARMVHSESQERYGFVGRHWVGLSAGGLLHMGARFYTPLAGRFLSSAPVWRFEVVEGRFTYAAGNPVNFVDPLGLQPDGGCQMGSRPKVDWSCFTSAETNDDCLKCGRKNNPRCAFTPNPGVCLKRVSELQAECMLRTSPPDE